MFEALEKTFGEIISSDLIFNDLPTSRLISGNTVNNSMVELQEKVLEYLLENLFK